MLKEAEQLVAVIDTSKDVLRNDMPTAEAVLGHAAQDRIKERQHLLHAAVRLPSSTWATDEANERRHHRGSGRR